MKKKTWLVIFLFFSISSSIAEEAVFLDTTDVLKLKAPKSFEIDMINSDNEGDFFKKSESVVFDSDEEIFESKAGKFFNKFIDDKVINNKINKFSSNIK